MPQAPKQAAHSDRKANNYREEFQDPVASNAPLGWIAIIDTGATLVHDGSANGGVTIASDGVTEGVTIYRPASVQLDTKYFEMECTFTLTDADDQDFMFGLSSATATTNPEDLWDTVSDDSLSCGVLDGAATVVLTYDKSNGGLVTQTASTSLLDATEHTMRLEYANSTSEVRVYVDDVEVLLGSTAASVPDDVPLSPFVGSRTGGNLAHTTTISSLKYYIDYE